LLLCCFVGLLFLLLPVKAFAPWAIVLSFGRFLTFLTLLGDIQMEKLQKDMVTLTVGRSKTKKLGYHD
jgi:hypothetical protein